MLSGKYSEVNGTLPPMTAVKLSSFNWTRSFATTILSGIFLYSFRRLCFNAFLAVGAAVSGSSGRFAAITPAAAAAAAAAATVFLAASAAVGTVRIFEGIFTRVALSLVTLSSTIDGSNSRLPSASVRGYAAWAPNKSSTGVVLRGAVAAAARVAVEAPELFPELFPELLVLVANTGLVAAASALAVLIAAAAAAPAGAAAAPRAAVGASELFSLLFSLISSKFLVSAANTGLVAAASASARKSPDAPGA